MPSTSRPGRPLRSTTTRMGVEAFHALPGPADASRRSRPAVVRGNQGIPLSGVAGMGRRQLRGVHRGLGLPDPSGGLDPADRLSKTGSTSQ